MKFTILVPYRNRLDHLRTFVPHILSFAKNYSPTILVIEQADSRPFNRGSLLNAGFLLAHTSDWVAFHDVDMLPLDSSCDYSIPTGVCHLAERVEQFGFGMPYINYFGGVLLATPASIVSVNGFSNQYWGWGCEDDDLFIRFWRMKMPIERRPGRYSSLPHPRAARTSAPRNHRVLYEVLQSSAIHAFESKIRPMVFRRSIYGAFDPRPGAQILSRYDGLSTLKFRIIEKTSLQSYTSLNPGISLAHQVVSIELL